MQPTMGRIVTAVGGRAASNGIDTCPALITRVWGQRKDGAWTVNATLFPDATDPRTVTSMLLWPDKEAARSSLQHGSVTALHWPARV